jgi:hypothetical protein
VTAGVIPTDSVAAAPDEARNAVRLVLLIILAGTLLRLAISAATGLGMDESYMAGNARQFMLSYVDHAPLHVWAAGLAERIFSSEAPLVVRLPFILFFAGSTWLMFALTRVLFGARAGLWAATAFNIAPVFTYAHASWVLPDGPAIFFMLASATVVAPLLLDGGRVERPTLRWLAAGALGGLAMLSKYNGVFIFAGVLAFVLTVPPARRHLATSGPWLGALLALLIFSPVIVWNVQHADVGIVFQTRRLPHAAEAHPLWLAEYVGGQMLYLFPLLAVPFAISLFRALRAGPAEPRGWLMAMIAIGPIAIFTVISLWAHSLPHWPMPGWVFTIPLFGCDAARLAAARPRFARGYMAVSAALVGLLLGAFAFQASRGGLAAESPAAPKDFTLDLLEWRQLGPELAARGLLGPDAVVASPIWMYAGKASHALGPDVPVLCVCEDPQQFRFRYDHARWIGRDMPVIVAGGDNQWMWDVAAKYFDRLDPLPPIMLERAGRPALRLDLAMGRNLRLPPEYGWPEKAP